MKKLADFLAAEGDLLKPDLAETGYSIASMGESFLSNFL